MKLANVTPAASGCLETETIAQVSRQPPQYKNVWNLGNTKPVLIPDVYILDDYLQVIEDFGYQ